MPPEPNRLFFALTPPQEVCSQIEKTALLLHSNRQFGGRLLKPRRYHITLYFLGDSALPETEAASLRAAEKVDAPPFTMHLNQAGSFNNQDIPVWLGSSETPQELELLEKKIRLGLAHLPRARQPRFKPHLTIVRDAAKPLGLISIEPIEWQVTSFVLIRSVLHEKPARYEVLGRFPLQGKPLPPKPEQASLF